MQSTDTATNCVVRVTAVIFEFIVGRAQDSGRRASGKNDKQEPEREGKLKSRSCDPKNYPFRNLFSWPTYLARLFTWCRYSTKYG